MRHTRNIGSIHMHLTNVRADNQYFIEQAASNTGFRIFVNNNCRHFNGKTLRLAEGYVAVWTYESRDHAPFWTEYDRLKAEASKVKR